MITKLRCKFVIIILFIVTLVMFLAFYSNYAIIKNALYNQSIETLTNTINTQKADDYKTFFVIKDSTGIIQQSGHERSDIKDLVEKAMESDTEIGEIEKKNLRFLKYKTTNYVCIAFTSTSEEKTTLNNMTDFATTIISCSVIVFLGISIFLAYFTTKPVSESIKRQKQLIADASHELKTPITAIIASSDILMSNSELNDDDKQWVNGIKTSAEDMSFLISDMLSLAHSDNKKQKVAMTPINLSELAVSVCLNFEPVFFEAGKNFTYTADDDVYINGNENSLKQFIKIFLDNAGKHSDANGNIALSLKIAQDKVFLSVYNSGPPIPESEIHKIFERFYRVDKARTSTTGSGLGLSIAKRIAEEHSTKIGVSSDETGTYFFTAFKILKQKK